MRLIDSAGEFLRLTEHYRKLTDEELLKLAHQPSALTDDAQQILRNEISARRLELQAPEEPPAHDRPAYVEPEPDSLYAEDRELVQLCTVWSRRDALQLQRLLDIAGIPFVMGLEKATSVDAVTSNFSEGVPVGVMSVGYPWAREALTNYEPADEPPDFRGPFPTIPVTCPKCHSQEVIFERRNPKPRTREEEFTAKFEWTCAACGHHWVDDGVVKEK